MLTNHDNLEMVETFEVLTASDTIEWLKLTKHVSGRISDHSILACTLNVGKHLEECSCSTKSELTYTHANARQGVRDIVSEHDMIVNGHGPVNGRPTVLSRYCKPPCRFRKGTLPDEYMTDVEVVKLYEDMINKLLESILTQEKIEGIYDDLFDTYQNDMAKYLKELDATPKSKKNA